MKAKAKATDDILKDPTVPMPTFGTGEVARVLGTEIWRVQKFLDSPKYRITPRTSGLGIGKGSRRVFTDVDVYRLGVADHLVRKGFSYKFVSAALEQLDDNDLLGPFGDEGEEIDLVYVLIEREGKLEVTGFGRDRTIRDMTKRVRSSSFYVLDVNAVINEIQKRMRGR